MKTSKDYASACCANFSTASTAPVRDAFLAAAQSFHRCRLRDHRPRHSRISYAAMTSMLTSSAESAGINRRWFRERAQDYVPHVARGIAAGMAITASEYLTAQRARHRIREAVNAAYEKVDIIASPTTARVAPLACPRRPGQRRRFAACELQPIQSTALPEHARPARLLAPLRYQSRRSADRHAAHRRLVRRSNGAECRCGIPERDRLAQPQASFDFSMKDSPRRTRRSRSSE